MLLPLQRRGVGGATGGVVPAVCSTLDGGWVCGVLIRSDAPLGKDMSGGLTGRVASAPAQDLDCHHSVISDWGRGITARENMYIVSIPSLFDPSLAPPGKHVVRG